MTDRRGPYRKIISKVLLFGLGIYTRITGRPRVRVLVVNDKEEVLLVKTFISQGDHWSLPGGGVGWREENVEAAQRELREETGVRVPLSELSYVRTLSRPEVNIAFHAPIFVTRVKGEVPVKNPHRSLEIIAINWFSIDKLPESLSQTAEIAIREYQSAK